MNGEVYRLDRASSHVASALERLSADLKNASNIYTDGGLEDQRFAVASQLSSIFEFLTDQGISSLELEPMMRPVDALKNQYVNRVDPMFAERRRPGKPEMSEDQLNRIGTLAALANAWLDLKSTGSDTNVQLVAATQRLKGRWFGRVTVAQLKRARMIVSQEVDEHPSVQTFKTVSSFIARMVVDHGRGSAFDIVIRHLNEQPPSPALGNWAAIKGE